MSAQEKNIIQKQNLDYGHSLSSIVKNCRHCLQKFSGRIRKMNTERDNR